MILSQEAVQAFSERFPTVKKDEPMAAHTYLKIGGPARLYLVADTKADALRAVQTAQELSLPWYVIGGGSNLLVADEGYEGVVIQMAERTITIQGAEVIASAGAFTARVARAASEAGLTGFEWGSGVPGTIGGATYGNAGCFGGEMKDAVARVAVLELATGQERVLLNADCGFGYRDSRFKHERFVILETTLALTPGDRVISMARVEEIGSKRKDTQPQGAFSAGCLFKNFDYASDGDLVMLRQNGPEIPQAMQAQKRIAAGWLIEQLGLKGMSIGNAQVSPVHGNFLVNRGGARAQDVVALASIVKMKVRDTYGILLEDEVQYLGF